MSKDNIFECGLGCAPIVSKLINRYVATLMFAAQLTRDNNTSFLSTRRRMLCILIVFRSW